MWRSGGWRPRPCRRCWRGCRWSAPLRCCRLMCAAPLEACQTTSVTSHRLSCTSEACHSNSGEHAKRVPVRLDCFHNVAFRVARSYTARAFSNARLLSSRTCKWRRSCKWRRRCCCCRGPPAQRRCPPQPCWQPIPHLLSARPRAAPWAPHHRRLSPAGLPPASHPSRLCSR